ncbi:carboxypeptidase-like regulatory domain-containing protein [Arthrobacter sp. NEB 688]|uniref:carboxypeptidase-like regulatory domain-containing protein n=1 Tax=Arthrobacter sp. NEB 688 TaxID=904039 RepID=UPI0015634941|nr:carboxypeptidase-like regulatory domain-containing protein [Arthrobacter sp. NEB 688]QKE85465.1 carboxypeptidase regulatory-like domain-containing protein [Arthrobacter sp. NEB 688]
MLGVGIAVGALLGPLAVSSSAGVASSTQQAVPRATAVRASAGTVTGVVRGPDGRPAPRVLVTVTTPDALPGRTWSGRTGADGRYAIHGIPGTGIGGEWCADTSAQSRPLASRCASQQSLAFDASRRATMDVWLRTGREVRGVVRGSDGRAVGGASVVLDRLGPDGLGPEPAARLTARRDGTFRTFVEDRVRVCAWAPDVRRPGAPQGWAPACGPDVRPGGPVETLVLSPGAGASGRVTDASGAPLAGVRVAATSTEGGIVPHAVTRADGRWTLRGLGAWQGVLVVDPGAVPGRHGTGFVWQPHTDPVSGRQVELSLVVGAVVPGVDDVLAEGAAIRGRALDPRGRPAPGVLVTAGQTRYAGEPTRTAVTARDGGYRVLGIRPGYGFACVDPRGMAPTDANLLAECWKDQTDGSSTALTLTAGKTLSGINPRLDQAGAVAVRVVDDTGKALGGATVGVADGSNQRLVTGVDGRATFRHVRPGDQAVILREGTVTPEASPTGIIDSLELPGVTVVAGRTARLTVTARRGAAVAGRVTDARGRPLDGVEVGQYTGAATTGADGRYVLRGLDAGSGPTVVCFYPRFARGPAADGYAQECFQDEPDVFSADPVAVTNGRTTRLATTVLGAAGSIGGRVTLPDGSPAESVGVSVSTLDGRSVGAPNFPSTDADGRFRVGGIPEGEYRVCFSPNVGYDHECWDDAEGADTATTVVLGDGQARTGIDAVLDPLASISGSVTDPDGVPVAGAEVSVSGSTELLTTTVDDGSFTVSDVPRGSWTVCVRPVGELVGECWRDAEPGGDVTPVVVRSQPVTGIALTPPRGGVVSGTVTGSGAAVPGALVTVRPSGGGETRSATVSPDDGSYRVGGLATGSYVVCAQAEGAWLPTCWQDAADEWSATPVQASVGSTTSGIDLRLREAAQVSGVVRSADGAPAPDVFVLVSDDVNGRYGYGITDGSGRYTVGSLAPGDYSVCADGPTGSTCFGAPDGGVPPTLPLPGGTTDGIDITLRP